MTLLTKYPNKYLKNVNYLIESLTLISFKKRAAINLLFIDLHSNQVFLKIYLESL